MEISVPIFILSCVASVAIGVSFSCMQQFKGFWIRLDDILKNHAETNKNITDDFRKTTAEASKANLSQAAKIDELIQRVGKVEETQNFMRQTRR